MIGDLKLISLAKGLMRYSGERQQVVADNIARADVPGAKARELEPFSFDQVLARQSTAALTPVVTNAQHLSGSASSAAGTDFKVKVSRDTYEVAPDGNNIVLEEQLLYADEARRDHFAGTSIYKKFTSFFRIALGGGA